MRTQTSRAWILALLTLPAFLHAREWSTFRGDVQRSGITQEALALPLQECWRYRPPQAPVPAWPAPMATNFAVMHGPLRQTLTFDRAFHVVADSALVYFGSSADDTVRCVDAETGALRWHYTTEGPIRVAPVLGKDHLFVGSDDGLLYALDPQTGTCLWTYRAGPDGRRLPGNGRMISLWPVRSGLVVDQGILYFTAGLFPSRGVFLCGLDADSGREVLKRKLDFTAQGTMLASADRLFVPTGRTAFWSCDRKDGRPLTRYGNSDPWKMNLVGGSTAVVADGVLATGPSEDGQLHWFKVAAKNPFARMVTDCAIINGNRIFLLGSGKLTAYDRETFLIEPKNPKERKEPPPLWIADADQATTMIMAEEHLVAGGQNGVAVFDARDGRMLWSVKLSGRAEGLAVCNGRLLVSLDSGETLCFRRGEIKARLVSEATTGDPFSGNPQLAQVAETAIRQAGTTKGYCLVLQAGSGQLAWEIAKRSEFRVICQDQDPARVAAMREAFLKCGLLGKQIEVHAVDDRALPYPKYFANLIVSERALTIGQALPPAEQVLRVLRPCGGVVRIAAQDGSEARRQLDAWGSILPEWKVSSGEAIAHGTARRGPLPGSGEWSHFYADPGNSACSRDEIKPVAMDLQWFGRPGPEEMVDRHKKGSAPLYVNGRLFVPGFNYVAGVDAYNGFVLWERKIPDSVRVGAFRDSSCLAATASQLLVAAGDHCLVLDAQTGETHLEIPAVGDQPQKAWGYLAAVDNLIIGSVNKPGGSLRAMTELEDTIIWRNEQPVICSTSLFAVNRDDGKTRWSYPAKTGAIINPGIAIGGGRIYFVESRNPGTLQSPDGRIDIPTLVGQGARLVALDLKSGKPAWEKDVDLASLQHILFLSYANERLLITGTKYATVDPSETKGRTKPAQLKRIRYDLFGFDARTGTDPWQVTATPNYDEVLNGAHGEQVQHPAIIGDIVYGPAFAFHLSTGQPYEGWKWQKSHKCATVSTAQYCIFSRFTDAKVPYMFDLATGNKAPLTLATRPGCWINTIPAGGLILIPEASAGCTCEYPIQTSLALVPAD